MQDSKGFYINKFPLKLGYGRRSQSLVEISCNINLALVRSYNNIAISLCTPIFLPCINAYPSHNSK